MTSPILYIFIYTYYGVLSWNSGNQRLNTYVHNFAINLCTNTSHITNSIIIFCFVLRIFRRHPHTSFFARKSAAASRGCGVPDGNGSVVCVEFADCETSVVGQVRPARGGQSTRLDEWMGGVARSVHVYVFASFVVNVLVCVYNALYSQNFYVSVFVPIKLRRYGSF